ncbi:MAG: chalcone isomerase family protein [Proteobacteria bacterium]|nr:chalcone isomerase family protein [Pseudomonadota bacterium]
MAIGVAWLWIPAADAGEIEGVEFADQIAVEDQNLALSGLGLLRYRVLFRGYVAGLYLPAGTAPERVLDDVSKRLEIEYFWAIRAGDFARAADAFLERNADPATRAALAERVARLHAGYRDVSPGDRYALTYQPGRGTSLALNGQELVRIPGADFAAAYFAIWLGPEPLNDSLRNQLLSPL